MRDSRTQEDIVDTEPGIAPWDIKLRRNTLDILPIYSPTDDYAVDNLPIPEIPEMPEPEDLPPTYSHISKP
ncbi:hypothetical protein HDV02_002881 [Globomyces sp. JEL0801]|nr:hypothetical protein HDV02_002881 [Globomyces sp. JEL0801]